MKRIIFIVAGLAAVLSMAAPRAEAINIIATTSDLAALVTEVGGDKVTVEALARGYRDPHFVEAKPSFVLKLNRADLLVVGRELEIGWLPPLITQSRNAKIQPGADGYFDASLTAKILEIPTGQITRAMGDVHPLGNPHYWLDPENGRASPRRCRPSWHRGSGQRGALRPARRGLRSPAERGAAALEVDDGAVQGHQDRHLPSLLGELR